MPPEVVRIDFFGNVDIMGLFLQRMEGYFYDIPTGQRNMQMGLGFYGSQGSLIFVQIDLDFFLNGYFEEKIRILVEKLEFDAKI